MTIVGDRLAVSAAVLGLLAALLVGGCAQKQWKFDTLGKRDRLRFAACRHDVARHLCPDDPDCKVRAAEMYANEPPDARLRFLLDYKCPRDTIEHADKTSRDAERRSIGME